MSKKYGVLSSSVNTEQLSLTFKGIAVGLIPFIVIIIKLSGGDIDEKSLTDAVDSIGDVILAAGVLISSVMVTFGIIRKIAVSLKIIQPKE